MYIQDKIDELVSLATPLRALDEDDPAKVALGVLVNKINHLRQQQSNGVTQVEEEVTKRKYARAP